VLTTYVRAGEFVQAGQRLYKIANLDEMDVRVYVSGPQLAAIRLGQIVTVTADAGDGRRGMNGTIAWIASEAEFTPTPIQTRDERAELVYAVKIRVRNDGQILKAGMPVDVAFTARDEGR
jgi:HlyD family secretion protein